MAYFHQIKLDKLDEPEEMDKILMSFKIPIDENSNVVSCGLITSIDESTVIMDSPISDDTYFMVHTRNISTKANTY